MEKQTRLVAAGWALRTIVTFSTLGTLFTGAGCRFGGSVPGSTDGTTSKTSALTADQIRILGFEATTTDWSSPTGVLASSTTRSQGSFSASVRNNGWTEVISRSISSRRPS